MRAMQRSEMNVERVGTIFSTAFSRFSANHAPYGTGSQPSMAPLNFAAYEAFIALTRPANDVPCLLPPFQTISVYHTHESSYF